jgi:hypothetical protein
MRSRNFVATESESIIPVLLKILTPQRKFHILKVEYYFKQRIKLQVNVMSACHCITRA